MKTKNEQNGFTLLELMVTVALVGIVTATVVANINFGNRDIILKNAANSLVIATRRAQNLTLTGAIGPTGNVPENGYSLTIYAQDDSANPNSYAINAEYATGPQLIGEIMNLSDKINVQSPNGSATFWQIKFLPLNQGITLINSQSSSEMNIKLNNQNGHIKIFYINAYSGLTEVR